MGFDGSSGGCGQAVLQLRGPGRREGDRASEIEMRALGVGCEDVFLDELTVVLNCFVGMH